MTTFVEAFALGIGLDPTQFKKGSADVQSNVRKMREATQKEGKSIEKSMDDAGESIARLGRNALKLFAILTAGRAIKDFVTDITGADAALGRLAKSVGSTPETISAMANAVARNGGSAQAAAQSFERLSDSINEIKTTGNSSLLPWLARLQGLGGKQISLNKDLNSTFLDMAENAKNVAAVKGDSQAVYLLKQLGLSQEQALLFIKGREAVQKELAKSTRVGIVRKEDAEAAQRLQTTLETLRQTSESFGRAILTKLTPVIVDLLERLQKWIDTNKDLISDDLLRKVQTFADELRKIPWDDVARGMKGFVVGANEAAQSVGGWKTVVEGLFALWALSKVAKVLAAIGMIRSALVVGDTSLLAAMLRVGLPVAIGAVATGHGFQTPEQYKKKLDTDAEAKRFDDERLGQRDRVRNWFGRQWDRIRRPFGGGSAAAGEGRGGAGIRTRSQRSVAATEAGRLNAREPEGAGKYRPEYKLSDADLSQRTADIIAGEAIRRNPESIDAVINNMMNRLGSKGWGPSGNLQEVATAPKQYEAAWKGSKASPSETEFIRSRIRAIASGGVPDNTGGANTYRAESYYRGRGANKPWARTLGVNGKTVGGNRYAYDPSAANGPYAPYATPKDVPPTQREQDLAAIRAGARKPEILSDPKDERRKPEAAPQASAWKGYPQAAGVAAEMRQAAVQSTDSRSWADNRQNTTNSYQTTFNGDFNFPGRERDGQAVASDLRESLKGRSFAMAANVGSA